MFELCVQESMSLSQKKDKASVTRIYELARVQGVRVTEMAKHDMNLLCDNRPHQGFLLKSSPRTFTDIDELPPRTGFELWLALDEVWDPQNFGALLRTSYFLGCAGVVSCARNSAPLSAVVSKASSGAMELMKVHSTMNMMRFLDKSRANGWQVIGAGLEDGAVGLAQLVVRQPTVLVLGNEGHGLRTNVRNRCDVLVKISPSDNAEDSTVDSLNVSVTGGILMHHILAAGAQAS
jgi:21S rRNA (GM2251-2'-O)-methyltransferase